MYPEAARLFRMRGLNMGDGHSVESQRSERLEEAIFSSNLDQQHIPVDVEVIKMPSSMEDLEKRVDKIDTRVGMVEQSVASIDTILIGRDGKGGAIERLERGQKETREILENTTREIKASVAGMANLHHNDVNSLDEKVRDNHEDIKDIKVKVEENRETVDNHLKWHAKKKEDLDYRRGARQWSLIKIVITVILTAAATLFIYNLGI